MSNNTDEIGIEWVNNKGKEDGPEEVLFLWKSIESSLWTSGNNISVFVPSVEVNDIPNSKKSVWNNNKDVCKSYFGSSAGLILIEENYEEADSNKSWD